jgi:tRNA(Ile)-lysidine synthase
MNLKNLNVKYKTHKKILNYLQDKKILKVYKNFSKSLNTKEDLGVAVSGGPDSLSLAFLAKCFSLQFKLKIKIFIVDHKLRKDSSLEAKTVSNNLKKIGIESKILTWHGKKPLKKIQSVARDKRYFLLVNECKKNNIQNILLGHHQDDVAENFIIRIVRGSGLNGLVSFNKKTKYKNVNLNILRPLLDTEKKNLTYISKEVFNFYIKDPSNKNEIFKRTRVRNLLKELEKEGLDKKKLILTIDNLKDSNESIKFYFNKNMEENVFFSKKKNIYILKKNFFNQADEIVFRSLTKIIQLMGKKHYPVRGKSIKELIRRVDKKSFLKTTLGGCFIEIANETILISKET